MAAARPLPPHTEHRRLLLLNFVVHSTVGPSTVVVQWRRGGCGSINGARVLPTDWSFSKCSRQIRFPKKPIHGCKNNSHDAYLPQKSIIRIPFTCVFCARNIAVLNNYYWTYINLSLRVMYIITSRIHLDSSISRAFLSSGKFAEWTRYRRLWYVIIFIDTLHKSLRFLHPFDSPMCMKIKWKWPRDALRLIFSRWPLRLCEKNISQFTYRYIYIRIYLYL